MENTPQDSLDILESTKCITRDQHNAARGRPEFVEMLADGGGPSNLLAWMVVRSIVREEDLVAQANQALDSPLDEEAGASEQLLREDILFGALEIIQSIKSKLNHQMLQKLLDESIITQVQFEEATALLSDATVLLPDTTVLSPETSVLVSPAAALVWMFVQANVLTAKDWEAILENASDAGSHSAQSERAKIIEEAEAIRKKIAEEYYRLAKAHFWQQVFPGPKWAWILGALLIAGGVVWYEVVSARTPLCDAKTIRKTLDGMMFKATLDARRSTRSLERPDYPTIGGQSEIGYHKKSHVRACVTTVKFGDKENIWAYLIKPGKDSGQFIVAGANEKIIRQRYRNIDADGDFSNNAEPIGRQALEKAVRDGVTEFRKDLEMQNPGIYKLLDRMRQKENAAKLSDTDPDRKREIADIEPTGPCKEVDAGKKYVCKLMLEQNDRIFDTSRVLVGDFTFERAGENQWKTTSAFRGEYAAALGYRRPEELDSNE